MGCKFRRFLDGKFLFGAIFGLIVGVQFAGNFSSPEQFDIARKDSPSPMNALETVTTYPRILCWIVTQPASKFKAQMVKQTWGRKCGRLLFVSSQNDSSLPAVGFQLSGPESRSQLWNKAKLTFRYIYNNYLNEYDWFFKADDDTFAIMENLYEYVSTLNAMQPLILGRTFKYPEYGVNKFMTGGPGYLMTRETIKRMVEIGLNQKRCGDYNIPGNGDDLILGRCLESLNVTFGDTRDRNGLQRFIHYPIEDLYNSSSQQTSFTKTYDYYSVAVGTNCCSTQAISFHYISGFKAQLFEYLLYSLKISNAHHGLV